MAGFSGSNRLEFRIPWSDDDMVELEVRLESSDWRGCSSAYTTLDELRSFAKQLVEFSRDTTTAIAFEAGFVGRPPNVAVRLNEFDGSGHIACQVQLLNTDFAVARGTLPFQLSAAIATEAMAVDRFSRQLTVLLPEGNGVATLFGD